MKLKRYDLSDDDKAMFFGKHAIIRTYDYNYHIGKSGIGLSGNCSCEANSFLDIFLYADSRLIIAPNEYNPGIWIEGSNSANMWARDDGDVKQINRLNGLLLSDEPVHAFLTSMQKNPAYPTLLTFSRKAPPIHLYHEISPMEMILAR